MRKSQGVDGENTTLFEEIKQNIDLDQEKEDISTNDSLTIWFLSDRKIGNSYEKR